MLFVCTGNINRSPAAQIIMESLAPDYEVDSSCLNGNEGNITRKRMREALGRNGFEYREIRSKMTTVELIEWADMACYMQPSHLEKLIMIGGGSRAHRRKFVNFAGLIKKKRIHDPNYEMDISKYDDVVRDLVNCCEKFIAL